MFYRYICIQSTSYVLEEKTKTVSSAVKLLTAIITSFVFKIIIAPGVFKVINTSGVFKVIITPGVFKVISTSGVLRCLSFNININCTLTYKRKNDLAD